MGDQPSARPVGADATDADLVVAARSGDRAAFAILVERHWSLLTRLCRRMLGDRWLAEDAAQEAVVQAMCALSSLRRPEAFASWLAGIGLNVSRRQLQASRSPLVLSWDAMLGGRSGPLPEPVDREPSPADVVEAKELGERVRSAVDTLPPGQRSAVLLFYLAGLNHREVAATLGIDVGAVKTRLNKARRTLRRRLAPLWSDERPGGLLAGPKEVKEMVDEVSRPIAVRVLDVRRLPAEGELPAMHVVVLEEVGGERRLPIWIGEWEATAMAMQLTSQQPPRPMTYTLAASLLGEIGGRVRQVEITRLAESVFYASVEIVGPNGKAGAVDARPSDALNLALVTGAPILVHPSVFDTAANPPTPPPLPPRDPFGPGAAGARELLAEAMSSWPKLSTPPSP